MMESEVFAANEYIAACGDSGVIYNFECNAGDWWGGYSVYLNGPDGESHTSDDIFWCGGPSKMLLYGQLMEQIPIVLLSLI